MYVALGNRDGNIDLYRRNDEISDRHELQDRYKESSTMSCSCEQSGNVLPNNVPPLYVGYLQYYKAKWFTSDWSRVFGILYQDSSLVWWYETQMASRPEGIICLKLAPELIATGQYSKRLFQVPSLPGSISGTGLENVIAIGERRQRVHFFLAESQQDFNAWMTAIVRTLPARVPAATMAQPTQPMVQVPSAPNYQPAVQYVTSNQQPIPPTTKNIVVIRDSGPSYGGAAGAAVVGLAAGAVMGAALTDIAHTGGGGWGYGGYYNQDNDITIVNNYNVDYMDQGNFSTNVNDLDWNSTSYDDYDAGDDY